MDQTWVEQLFYFFYKDYGTTINYVRIEKANVDYETGQREDKKTVYPLSAVLTPKTIYSQFIAKVLGKTEFEKTIFLIKKSDLPAGFVLYTDDYFIHGNLRYGNLEIDDALSCYILMGKAVTNSLPYNVVQVQGNDNVGLNDGIA